MGWYDIFSRFYDRSLEPLYAAQRAMAIEALRVTSGSVVLDVPCGTGQSFDGIVPAILPDGMLLGVDLSRGMLDRARERVSRNSWNHVHLYQGDVHQLEAEALSAAAGRAVAIDRLHIFLGLTAFPQWEQAFERLWSLLAPGGRCVLVDVHAERPGFQGHMVNLMARADIRRKVWQPLEAVATDYERSDLPADPRHGGELYLATGTKPRG